MTPTPYQPVRAWTVAGLLAVMMLSNFLDKVVLGLVAVPLMAVIGYLLQFWGFRLTQPRGGTLHVARGLLTTRETSIEEKRLRARGFLPEAVEPEAAAAPAAE